jgi:hypothetical protein
MRCLSSDSAVEMVLVEELHLAHTDFDAVKRKNSRSAVEVRRVVDAYRLALYRFSDFVLNAVDEHLRELTEE